MRFFVYLHTKTCNLAVINLKNFLLILILCYSDNHFMGCLWLSILSIVFIIHFRVALAESF